MGLIHAELGDPESGVACLKRAVELSPKFVEAHANLGWISFQQGSIEESIEHYTTAAELQPDSSEIQNNMGLVLLRIGRSADALFHFKQALRLQPQSVNAYVNVARALEQQGELEQAAYYLQMALQRDPYSMEVHVNLGNLLVHRLDRFEEGVRHLREALHIDPGSSAVHVNLGLACSRRADDRGALAEFAEALRLRPDWPPAVNAMAWILATSHDPKLRNGIEAVAMAQAACEATEYKNPTFVETLAAAYAEAGRFEEAAVVMSKIIGALPDACDRELRRRLAERLEGYRQHKPHRDPPAMK